VLFRSPQNPKTPRTPKCGGTQIDLVNLIIENNV